MVVIGLGKNLLFKSVLGQCDEIAANNFPNEYGCGQRSQTGKIEIQFCVTLDIFQFVSISLDLNVGITKIIRYTFILASFFQK